MGFFPATQPSPAVTPPLSPTFCLTGRVEPLITAPPPFRGDIIAVLITPLGQRVPLIQTSFAPAGLPLGQLGSQFSLVCGFVRQVGNRLAFDVQFSLPLTLPFPGIAPAPVAARPSA